MVPTRNIQVVVITERWAKAFKREDGTVVPEGWQKPKGWPAKASQRPDGNLNDFSRAAAKSYHECSLYQALTHRASSPAYFVGYKPTKIGLRLRKDCLNPLFIEFTEDAGGIHMQLALFDVDNHDDSSDFESWYEKELGKIAAFQEAHPGMIVYRSRRGYRLIGLLPEPIAIKDHGDSAKWDRLYTAWCNYLLRAFDIKADVLLDWTRFQAVPHTKKDRDQPALELEVFGDVEQIGLWKPKLEESDFPPEKVSGSYDGVGFDGECQLLALVNRANLRCEPTEYAHVYDICCPNWTAHSPDSRGLQDYPSKTVLYTNGPIGVIECKSSGCRMSHPNRQSDYFRHFDPVWVEETKPRPPVDVWDPDVLKLSMYRNNLSRNVGLSVYEQASSLEDVTYGSYIKALSTQIRLSRKSDDAVKQQKMSYRTESDYTGFAKWFLDQSAYKVADESAFQAYLSNRSSK